MLTSSTNNQYIRPEYLSPLPSNFDSKSSPLAMLQQTCSSIGADASPNPKLLANIEKSSKSHKESQDKHSPASNSTFSNSSASDTPKTSFKPYESSLKERERKSPDDRLHSINHISKSAKQTHHHTNGRTESNKSAGSPRTSPVSRKTPNHHSNSYDDKSISPHRASSKDSSHKNGSENSLDSPSNNKSLSSIKESNSQLAKTSTESSLPSLPSTTASPFMSGYPYPMDYITTSALMSQHHSMMKAAAMNPYLNYARMKAAAGNDAMMGICRDPYCTGCSLSSHMLGKSAGSGCPAGCTQCDHPGSKSFSAANSSAAHYAQLAALSLASHMPYVCNWIAGDSNYCGKRYSTSEELFQHLRTQHTGSAIPDSMLNSAAGIPPTHPLFQRSYPTPPLSPLSTARYHPYGKPSLLPPSMGPSSLAGLLPHPSLAQYFPPYSLYGPRLGSASNMHP